MTADIYCKNCRFFDDANEECRRTAPQHRHPWEFILPAYLQAISCAALTIARLDPNKFDEDLLVETTEFYRPRQWASVKENDWCGEFQERTK